MIYVNIFYRDSLFSTALFPLWEAFILITVITCTYLLQQNDANKLVRIYINFVMNVIANRNMKCHIVQILLASTWKKKKKKKTTWKTWKISFKADFWWWNLFSRLLLVLYVAIIETFTENTNQWNFLVNISW